MSDPDFPDTQDEARGHIQEIQDYYVGELDEETRLVDTTRESIAQMDKEFSGPQSVFLEFIQNAVDATSENNDCTISFEFHKDNLVVRNNADPFSHSDVESICTPRVRYGDDADNPDHIGFWGVGFHSSYIVSDAIEIISLPYKFKFDKKWWEQSDDIDQKIAKRVINNLFWRTTPIWIDEAVESGVGSNETIFRLWLTKKHRERINEQSGSTGQVYDDNESIIELADGIKPVLLVFIPELHSITIDDQVHGSTRKLTANREKELSDKASIHQTQNEYRWFVYRENFEPPEAVREDDETEERNRANIKQREIVVIFSISEDGQLQTISKSGAPEAESGGAHSHIYSFTPLGKEKVQLPFLLQGDFFTNVNRYNALEDPLWNRWLAEKAGETVVKAVRAVQNNEIQVPDEWHASIYNATVPQHKIRHRLFGERRSSRWKGLNTKDSQSGSLHSRSFAGSQAVIMEWFQNNESILTEEDGLKKPSQTRVPENSEVRELLSYEDVRQYRGKYYVAKEVRETWDEGVQERLLEDDAILDAEDVFNFVEKESEWGWISDQSETASTEWFSTLYAYLEDHSKDIQRDFSSLRNQPIVYTENGLRTAEGASLPPEYDEVQNLIEMIDPPLQPYVAADILDDPPEARQFLQDRLGVERVNSRSVILYLIEHLPDLEENFQDPEFIKTVLDTGENIDSDEFEGRVEAQIEATDYYPYLPAETDSAKDFYLKLLNYENQLDKDLLFAPDILEEVADQLDDISEIPGLERLSREELLQEIIFPLASSQAVDPDLLVTFTPYLQELPDEELDSLMVATSAGDVESPGNVWFNNDLLAYDIESIFGTDRQYLSHQYTNDVESIENSEDFFSSIGVNTGKTPVDIVGALDHLSSDCDQVSNERYKELYRMLANFTRSERSQISIDEGDKFKIPTLSGECRPIGEVQLPPTDDDLLALFDSSLFAWIPDPEAEYLPGIEALGLDRGPSIDLILNKLEELSADPNTESETFARLYSALSAYSEEELTAIDSDRCQDIKIPTLGDAHEPVREVHLTPSSEDLADALDPSRFAWVPDPPEDHRPALEALGVETELDVEDVIEELRIISHDHDEVPYDGYHDLYEVLTAFTEDELEVVEELSTEEIKLPTQSGGYERVDQLVFPYDDTVVSNLNSPSFVWVPEPPENYQTVLTVLGVQPTLEIGTVVTELRRVSQTCDRVSNSRFKEIYEVLSTFSDDELSNIAEIETDGIRLPTTTGDCTPIEQLVIPRNELVIEKLESPDFIWIPEPTDAYQPVLQALGIDEGPSIGWVLDKFDSISDRCEDVSRSQYADLYEVLATFPSEELQKISNHQTDYIRIPTSSGGCTSLEDEVYLPDNEIAVTKFNDDRIAWVPSSERDIAEVLRVLGAKSAENIIEPIRDSRDGPNPFQDNTEALLESVWNDLASVANIDADTPPEIIWKENIVVAYEAGEERDREHRLCLYDGTKHILYCTFQLLKQPDPAVESQIETALRREIQVPYTSPSLRNCLQALWHAVTTPFKVIYSKLT